MSLGGLSAKEKENKFATNDNKQLLDEVFVISRIIMVEVGVITRSRRLRLITITETVIYYQFKKSSIHGLSSDILCTSKETERLE